MEISIRINFFIWDHFSPDFLRPILARPYICFIISIHTHWKKIFSLSCSFISNIAIYTFHFLNHINKLNTSLQIHFLSIGNIFIFLSRSCLPFSSCNNLITILLLHNCFLSWLSHSTATHTSSSTSCYPLDSYIAWTLGVISKDRPCSFHINPSHVMRPKLFFHPLTLYPRSLSSPLSSLVGSVWLLN